jgi:8-oxo-dGTP diphosphatase
MNLQAILDLPAAHSRSDLPYLPIPNTVDVILCDEEAPATITRSAFVLPFLEDGSLVLATVRKRGTEIPGGHIEAGETSAEAAERECLEEVGCHLFDLVPIGFLRLHSGGEAPEGWRYPHPLGAQQFYAGKVRRLMSYSPNDECDVPTLVPADEVDAFLKPSDRVFADRAREVLFGMAPRP